MRAARHPVTILLLKLGQLVLESPNKPLVPLRYLFDLIRAVTLYLLQQSDHILCVYCRGKQVFVLVLDRCCLVARHAHVLYCLLLVKARVDKTALLAWLVHDIEGSLKLHCGAGCRNPAMHKAQNLIEALESIVFVVKVEFARSVKEFEELGPQKIRIELRHLAPDLVVHLYSSDEKLL